MRLKKRIEKLSEEDKFKYTVLFRAFPRMSIGKTFYIFYGIFSLWMLALYIAFYTTGQIELYTEQLYNVVIITMRMSFVISILIFMDLCIFFYNIYKFYSERNKFLLKRGV